MTSCASLSAATLARHREGPALSIIVLTYNRPLLLRDCLESLASQSESESSYEVIVADDGSAAETAAVVSRHAAAHANVRHVRHEHRGIPATRNLGLRQARAPIVAIVADDYLLAPDYVHTILHFFADHEDALVLRCAMAASRADLGSRISHAYYRASVLRRLTDPEAPVGGVFTIPRPPAQVVTRHGLEAAGGAAFRRRVFELVGEFDESLARAEDSDLTVRLRRNGIAVHYLPREVVRHQYDRYLRDTLVKCWCTGWYRYQHYRKNQLAAAGPGNVIHGLLHGKVMGVLAMLEQARGEGSLATVVVALPCVLLFELLNKAGFVCSWALSALRAQQA